MWEQQPQSNIEELIHVPDRSKLHSFEVMIKKKWFNWRNLHNLILQSLVYSTSVEKETLKLTRLKEEYCAMSLNWLCLIFPFHSDRQVTLKNKSSLRDVAKYRPLNKWVTVIATSLKSNLLLIRIHLFLKTVINETAFASQDWISNYSHEHSTEPFCQNWLVIYYRLLMNTFHNGDERIYFWTLVLLAICNHDVSLLKF